MMKKPYKRITTSITLKYK
uniref:Uncharacterized protein n=1 Tax=Rhizophora mucronata TaxID=61149 RepID=A0A2P2NW17_RHIMU